MRKKTQSSKGIPRRAFSTMRQLKKDRYWAKCTCYACKVVFWSPRRKRIHEKSDHIKFPSHRSL